MSAHRHRASFNGLTFNKVYVAGNTGTEGGANQDETFAEDDIRLEWMDPSALSTQDLRELRQHQEGANPNQMYEGIRTIHIGGTILASSYASLEDLTSELRRALAPVTVRMNSTAALVGTYPHEPVGVLPFDFTKDSASDPTGVDRRYYCRPGRGRPYAFGKRKSGLQREWQAWLLAYDPREYGQTLNTQTMGNVNGGAHANNIMVNAGNVPTYPQIRVRMTGASGDATAHLINTTTGADLTLDLDPLASSGEDFWIFPEAGELTNPSGVSRYSYRSDGFLADQFLVPGNNVYTWGDNTGITDVTFYWRDAWA